MQPYARLLHKTEAVAPVSYIFPYNVDTCCGKRILKVYESGLEPHLPKSVFSSLYEYPEPESRKGVPLFMDAVDYHTKICCLLSPQPFPDT